jgi:hypothetical protein
MVFCFLDYEFLVVYKPIQSHSVVDDFIKVAKCYQKIGVLD